MEELKLEIRSLLLSAKHGVLLKDLQRDYEDLVGKPLDYRKLGYCSMAELMSDLTDVAREDIDQEGNTLYHAISTSSTHHIKKMVQKQMSKKKKPSSRGRGRGRGRGSRGHFHVGHHAARGAASSVASRESFWERRGDRARRSHAKGVDGGFGHRTEIHMVDREHSDPVSPLRDLNQNENLKAATLRKFHFPLANLKINVTPGGSRFIKAAGSEQTQSIRGDLREYLTELNINKNSCNINRNSRDPESSLSIESGHFVSPENTFKTRKTSPSSLPLTNNRCSPEGSSFGRSKTQFENYEHFTKNLPPRFQRRIPKKDIIKVDVPSLEHDTNVGEVIERKEHPIWQPPENGEKYLAAFHNYFISKGEQPPQFQTFEGKASKRKGYYCQLSHQGTVYYPLEIMQTVEHAQQNVAKHFCQKNNISLSDSSVGLTSQGGPAQSTIRVAQPTTRVAQPTTRVAQQSGHEHLPKQPMMETSPQVSASGKPQQSPGSGELETVHKIYKILKETGVHFKALPKIYLETYAEEISFDLKPFLLNYPSFFELQEPIKNVFIIFPVKNALTKESTASNNQLAAPHLPQTLSTTPSCVLPAIGSKMDCVVSFVYSPEEFYVRDYAKEQLVQQMEQLLNSTITLTPIEATSLKVGNLIIGQYMNGWYRAVVRKIDALKLNVCYIDYGNTEEVSPDILRHMPDSNVLISTPALAIKCGLRRPPEAAAWVPDIISQLEALQDKPLTVHFIELKAGGLHKVDVYDDRGVCQNQDVLCIRSHKVRPSLASVKPDPVTSSPLPKLPVEQARPSATDRKPAQAVPMTGGLSPPSVLEVIQGRDEVLVTPAAQQTCSPTTPINCVTSPITSASSTHTLSRSMSSIPGKAIDSNVILTPDPEPLVIPSTPDISVFICDVLDDCSVLLRIVDTDFSDKLDDLENDIADNFDNWSQPKEVKLGNIYAAAVDADPGEFTDSEDNEGGECEDCKSYHRVRVVEKNKNDYLCFLPDHGNNEILQGCDLREIDPKLNRSLPYQVLCARLKDLDKVSQEHRTLARKILRAELLAEDCESFEALVTERIKQQAVDPIKVSRVRKILSCMSCIDTEKVVQVYNDVYKDSSCDVEAILQQISGLASWTQCIEVDLFDTEQDDMDININTQILANLDRLKDSKDIKTEFKDLYDCSFDSTAEDVSDDDQSQMPTPPNKLADIEDGTPKLSYLKTETQLDPSLKTETQPSPTQQSGALEGKKLYTWGTHSVPSSLTTLGVQSNQGDKKPTTQYWPYPLQKSIPIFIISAESPSSFVAIPGEVLQDLENMEAALNKALFESAVRPPNFVENHLYAVQINNKFYRALCYKIYGQQHKIYLPDSGVFDVVFKNNIFNLPEQFAKLPFMASRMCLGGVKPKGSSWSDDEKQWFADLVSGKILYAVIAKEEIQEDSLPLLTVILIDTNGEEDIVIHDYVVLNGKGVKFQL